MGPLDCPVHRSSFWSSQKGNLDSSESLVTDHNARASRAYAVSVTSPKTEVPMMSKVRLGTRNHEALRNANTSLQQLKHIISPMLNDGCARTTPKCQAPLRSNIFTPVSRGRGCICREVAPRYAVNRTPRYELLISEWPRRHPGAIPSLQFSTHPVLSLLPPSQSNHFSLSFSHSRPRHLHHANTRAIRSGLRLGCPAPFQAATVLIRPPPRHVTVYS